MSLNTHHATIIVGTLIVTDPEKWQHANGSATQGPESAILWRYENSILAIDMDAADGCGRLRSSTPFGPTV